MKLEFSLQGFFPVVGDAVEQLVEPSAEIADRYLLARVGADRPIRVLPLSADLRILTADPSRRGGV